MPHSRTHITRTHCAGTRITGTVLLCLVVVCALMLQAHAQLPQCDPETQYVKDGVCCKMCGPGTSMSLQSPCDEPLCLDCGPSEYQDRNTKESKCQRQPYCDPNSNFVVPVHVKTKRSTCRCKEGFHCSSEQCLTCLPHKSCGPGYGVQSKGNHFRDTVCVECPAGKYSDSVDAVCKEWTKCGEKQQLHQNGTQKSDTICVDVSRGHEIIIIVAVLLIAFIAITCAWLYYHRHHQGESKDVEKPNVCDDGGLTPETELLREPRGPITTPSENLSDPVEIDDESMHEYRRSRVYTNTGKIVTEEEGKAEILSLPESDAVNGYKL